MTKSLLSQPVPEPIYDGLDVPGSSRPLSPKPMPPPPNPVDPNPTPGPTPEPPKPPKPMPKSAKPSAGGSDKPVPRPYRDFHWWKQYDDFLASLPDVDTSYQGHAIIPEHDTCKWVFGEETFEVWGRSPYSSMVVIFGEAGSGKTYLAKVVANSFDSKAPDRSSFAFFCKPDDTRPPMLSSLLRFLVTAQPDLFDPSYVLLRRDSSSGPIDTASAVAIIQHMRKTAHVRHTFYVIVDGIDQCESSYIIEIFDSLSQAMELRPRGNKVPEGNMEGRPKFKFLFTCRGTRPVFLASADCGRFGMQPPARGDVSRYLETRARRLGPDLLPPNKQEEVRRTVLERAGTFWWYAKFAMDDIERERNVGPSGLRSHLYYCPKSLTEWYDHEVTALLDKIDGRQEISTAEKVSAELAYLALTIAAFDLKQISSEMVQDAFSRIYGNKNGLDAFGAVMEHCPRLLAVRPASGIRPIHFTFDNFIEDRVSMKEAHARIAETCVKYLMSPSFKYRVYPLGDTWENQQKNLIERYPFLCFAVSSWIWHLSRAEKAGRRLIPLLRDFLSHQNRRYYHNWLWLDAWANKQTRKGPYPALFPLAEAGCWDVLFDLLPGASEPRSTLSHRLSVLVPKPSELMSSVRSYLGRQAEWWSKPAGEGEDGDDTESIASISMTDISSEISSIYITDSDSDSDLSIGASRIRVRTHPDRRESGSARQNELPDDFTQWQNDDGKTLLWICAAGRGVRHIHRLLSYPFDLNHYSKAGVPFLHHAILACSSGPAGLGPPEPESASIIESLIRAGARPTICTSSGVTALHVAAGANNVSVMGVLVDHGASVNTGDLKGLPALESALCAYAPKAFAWLLANGADPDAEFEAGYTPLIASIMGDRWRLFLMLLEHADVNRPARNGMIPLLTSMTVDNPRYFNALLRHPKIDLHVVGACLEEDGYREGVTPVMQAVKYEKLDAVRVLLEAGASPGRAIGRPNHFGPLAAAGAPWMMYQSVGTMNEPTPLHMAVRLGLVDIVKTLLEFGASINDCFGNDCTTALTQAFNSGNFEIAKLLLEHGADASVEEGFGMSGPLLAATSRRHSKGVDPELASMLLNHTFPPDVNFFSRFGENALLNAATNGPRDDHRILELLLEHADLKAFYRVERQLTPLHVAAARGNLGACKLILEREPGLLNVIHRAESMGNSTALMEAARKGRVEVMKFLLAQGARKDIESHHWRVSAIFKAIEAQDVIAVKLLLEDPSDEKKDLPLQERVDRALLERQDYEGDTPFNYACQIGCVAVIRYLLDCGANFRINNIYSESTVECALRGDLPSPEYIIAMLLDRGLGVDEVISSRGLTILGEACRFNSEEPVRLLLDRGADPSTGQRGPLGKWRSALQIAVDNNSWRAVEVLLFDKKLSVRTRGKRGRRRRFHRRQEAKLVQSGEALLGPCLQMSHAEVKPIWKVGTDEEELEPREGLESYITNTDWYGRTVLAAPASGSVAFRVRALIIYALEKIRRKTGRDLFALLDTEDLAGYTPSQRCISSAVKPAAHAVPRTKQTILSYIDASLVGPRTFDTHWVLFKSMAYHLLALRHTEYDQPAARLLQTLFTSFDRVKQTERKFTDPREELFVVEPDISCGCPGCSEDVDATEGAYYCRNCGAIVCNRCRDSYDLNRYHRHEYLHMPLLGREKGDINSEEVTKLLTWLRDHISASLGSMFPGPTPTPTPTAAPRTPPTPSTTDETDDDHVKAVCLAALHAQGYLALRHPLFARKFDLTRSVGERISPVFQTFPRELLRQNEWRDEMEARTDDRRREMLRHIGRGLWRPYADEEARRLEMIWPLLGKLEEWKDVKEARRPGAGPPPPPPSLHIIHQ